MTASQRQKGALTTDSGQAHELQRPHRSLRNSRFPEHRGCSQLCSCDVEVTGSRGPRSAKFGGTSLPPLHLRHLDGGDDTTITPGKPAVSITSWLLLHVTEASLCSSHVIRLSHK